MSLSFFKDFFFFFFFLTFNLLLSNFLLLLLGFIVVFFFSFQDFLFPYLAVFPAGAFGFLASSSPSWGLSQAVGDNYLSLG